MDLVKKVEKMKPTQDKIPVREGPFTWEMALQILKDKLEKRTLRFK
jgi:hypothetical protein